MKRLLFALVVLAGLVGVIHWQRGRLEAAGSLQGRARREAALAQLTRLPPPSKAAVRAKPARTEHLEEIIRKSPKVMGGVPLPFPEQLFDDYPGLQADFLDAKKGQQRLKYAAFFAQEKLTPEQIERFLEISLDGERQWIAQSKAAAARGVELSDPAIKAMGVEGTARRKEQLAALFNADQTARLERYRNEWPTREALTEMVKSAGLGAGAMTPDQFNQLVTLTAEAGVFDNERPLQSVEIISGASRKAAQILTPEQLALYDNYLDARQAIVLRSLVRKVMK